MSSPTPCYHCGLPVPPGGRYQARILGETRALCCPGCQAVGEAIAAAGLEGYYRHRSDTAVNPQELAAAPTDALQLLDRQDVQASFVRHEGGHGETHLQIEGISCAACGWLIEKHLRAQPGVVEASLNLSSQRLHLRWLDAATRLSRLLDALQRIGYAGHPWQADEASARLLAENRRALRRIGVAGLLWIQVMMATMATWPEFNVDLSPGMDRILRWTSLLLTTPIVFYSSAPFFRGALRDLRGRRLGMDVSVSLAIAAAYGAGIWSTLSGRGELYFDAVGMFALFLLAGRYLERRARQRTAATARLLDLLPATCLRLDDDGRNQRILLGELRLGDRLTIAPGALLPADGRVLQGHSSVDESLLTGEYLPQPRQPGDRVTAGTLNGESPLIVEVQALGDDTRLSAIVRLLERAQSEKPRTAELADRVAHHFVPVTLVAAACVGLAWWQLDADRAFWIVLSLLVATCPCALSLATPMALTAATGSLYRLGLLPTRGHVLAGLERIDTVIFDKTGTLTEGRLALKDIQPLRELDGEACLALAAALEQGSEHPVARAFGFSERSAERIDNIPGQGLEGVVAGKRLRIGQAAFVAALAGSPIPKIPGAQGQWLLLGDEAGALAWFVLDDRVRDDAAALLQSCRTRGWRILLLSGDSSPMVAQVARELGIDEVRGGMTPDAKLDALRRLQAEGRRVLMLGDGINDVPALAGADVSIAMGGASDLARTSADAVLLSNRLGSLVQALQVARRTRRIVSENLAWACLYNGLVLPFAALGWVTPLWAALGMSLSSLLVVLNALRLTRLNNVNVAAGGDASVHARETPQQPRSHSQTPTPDPQWPRSTS
jgi:Cu2+-exporting ATPase